MQLLKKNFKYKYFYFIGQLKQWKSTQLSYSWDTRWNSTNYEKQNIRLFVLLKYKKKKRKSYKNKLTCKVKRERCNVLFYTKTYEKITSIWTNLSGSWP